LDWLAVMAGRSVTALEYALADSGHRPSQAHPARRGTRKADKPALLATIRSSYEQGLSIRAISDRLGVHRRTVAQALESPVPRQRKKPAPRKSRLDPFKDAIDDMLRQDLDTLDQSRLSVKTIMDVLTVQHELTGVSYSTIRDYVTHRRIFSKPRSLPVSADIASSTPSHAWARGSGESWSPSHHAVEGNDLPRLRDLLDAGHDVEGDNGDGWTLLRHAIHGEHDRHLQTGEPLHADITAFLLARGADPRHRHNGTSVIEEAETRGHWLASVIMHAWISRGQRHSPTLPQRPNLPA
jgi:transposase